MRARVEAHHGSYDKSATVDTRRSGMFDAFERTCNLSPEDYTGMPVAHTPTGSITPKSPGSFTPKSDKTVEDGTGTRAEAVVIAPAAQNGIEFLESVSQ